AKGATKGTSKDTGKAAKGKTGASAKGASAKGATSIAGADTSHHDTTGQDSTNLASLSGGAFSRLVQQGQMPGEYYVAQSDVPTVTRDLSLPEVQALIPPGKVIRWSGDTVSMANRPYRALYVLDQRPIITGEYITDAQPETDQIEGTKVNF